MSTRLFFRDPKNEAEWEALRARVRQEMEHPSAHDVMLAQWIQPAVPPAELNRILRERNPHLREPVDDATWIKRAIVIWLTAFWAVLAALVFVVVVRRMR